MLDEYEGNLEDKPKEAGRCATGMNSPEVLEHRGATKAEPQRRPLRDRTESIRFQWIMCNVYYWDIWLTLANNVLTVRYRNRPKTSFRIKTAVKRFPRTRALAYFRGYLQMLSAARRIPMRLRVMTNVKNFLCVQLHQATSDKDKVVFNDLYVLNQSLN